MKIIVTGGAGFIGSHIVDVYIAHGHSVVVIDNLATGLRKNVNPKAKLYKADICNLALVEKIFKRERPEILNHHAAMISVADSVHNPLPVYAVNVQGTANVLSAYGAYGKGKNKKVIFASSAAIYGNAKRVPTPENAPLAPLSPYGSSKVLGEKLVRTASKQYGFRYVILRYANAYGPRQNKVSGGVISKVPNMIKKGMRPILYGNGGNVRDYVYVEDIARANILALSRGREKILNIATSIPTKDKDLLALLCGTLHYHRTLLKKPARKGEIKVSVLDARRAKKLLGWKPAIALKEGLRKTLPNA